MIRIPQRCHYSTIMTFTIFSQLLLLILILIPVLLWSRSFSVLFYGDCRTSLDVPTKKRQLQAAISHMLNADACVVTGTSKFDRGLLWLLHSPLSLELLWLDVLKRVMASCCSAVFSGTCTSLQVCDISSWQHLQSASCWLLVIPECWLSVWRVAGLSI